MSCVLALQLAFHDSGKVFHITGGGMKREDPRDFGPFRKQVVRKKLGLDR